MIHKAKYLMPGALFPEDTVVTLSERSADEAARKAPTNAYCFTLYDTAEPVDLGPEYQVAPKAQNESGRYYLGGIVFSADDIRRLDGDHDVLLANMRANHWRLVIRCRPGNWQPFNVDEDTLVDVLSPADSSPRGEEG